MHIDYTHLAALIGVDADVMAGDYHGTATVFYTIVDDVEYGRADDRFGVITYERAESVEDTVTAGTADDLVAALHRLKRDGATITLVEIPDNIAHQLLTHEGQAA